MGRRRPRRGKKRQGQIAADARTTPPMLRGPVVSAVPDPAPPAPRGDARPDPADLYAALDLGTN